MCTLRGTREALGLFRYALEDKNNCFDIKQVATAIIQVLKYQLAKLGGHRAELGVMSWLLLSLQE